LKHGLLICKFALLEEVVFYSKNFLLDWTTVFYENISSTLMKEEMALYFLK